METNSFSSSTCIANVDKRLFLAKPFGLRKIASKNKVAVTATREANNRDFDGKLVDENMIILRMRIKDMKIMEENRRQGQGCKKTGENWMEWEKQYYCKHYHEDLCDGIGLLQMYLMNTRPCLALGMLALVALSVPISTSVVIFNVFQIVNKGFLSGFVFR